GPSTGLPRAGPARFPVPVLRGPGRPTAPRRIARPRGPTVRIRMERLVRRRDRRRAARRARTLALPVLGPRPGGRARPRGREGPRRPPAVAARPRLPGVLRFDDGALLVARAARPLRHPKGPRGGAARTMVDARRARARGRRVRRRALR